LDTRALEKLHAKKSVQLIGFREGEGVPLRLGFFRLDLKDVTVAGDHFV
jgi:hypothetical protein